MVKYISTTFIPRIPYSRPIIQSKTPISATNSSPRRSPRPENAPGPFYVDHTCIDCDICRWMAPDTFHYSNEQSAVSSQPQTPDQRHAALQALLACPTQSIHVTSLPPGQLAAARDSFPLPITSNIYHCGFHSEKSFSATPYFIHQRHIGGSNIMIDVPRWQPHLAAKLESTFGGLDYIFLTHRDDVGDHQRWADRFPGSKRIIHQMEVNSRQGTDKVEIQLQGEGQGLLSSWYLDGRGKDRDREKEDTGEEGRHHHHHHTSSSTDIDSTSIELLFTPGHTRGCVSLLYKPAKVLFTGDHLAYSGRLGRLSIMRGYNWYSVDQQLQSVARLMDVEFSCVLPGHGRRVCFESDDEKRDALRAVLDAEGYVVPIMNETS